VKHGLALVLGMALLAHGVGLRNGFVYDDHRFVLENHALETASVAELMLDPAAQTSDDDRHIFRPLRTLGFAFDLRRWGDVPFGFHLHSILAHLVTVALAFGCLRRLLPAENDAPALLGAAALAVHPLGVEVVGWISSRGDIYALGFALGALWMATLSEKPGRTRRAVAGLDTASFVLAMLATLGKESAIWLPAVAACRIVFLQRGRWASVVSLALGFGAAFVMRQWALSNVSPMQAAPHGGTWLSQVGWALYGTGRMLTALVLPRGLSVDYAQHTWVAGSTVWLRPQTMLTAGVIILLLMSRRRAPRASFAVAWLLLAYLPSSSLLVTLRSLLNDRAAYPMLPALGVLAALPLGVHRGALRAAVLGSALVLIPLSIERTGVFLSDRTLWLDVLRKQPASVRAYLGLSVTEPDVNRDRREHYLLGAVAAAPAGGMLEGLARSRLGDFLLGVRNDPERALPELHRSLELLRFAREGSAAGAEENVAAGSLAEALALLGHYEESDALLARVLEEQPHLLMLHIKRGALGLMRFERTADPSALDVVQQGIDGARALQPDHPLVRALAVRLAERRSEAD
jgi:hypothetical protein